MILPVIMAGGCGTRLWPLSRSNYPKQFLSLNGEDTMLQQTLSRLEGLEHEAVMLICNEEHRFIAAEQIRKKGISHNGIFLEPVGRNTAPAIALAAFKALAESPEANLLVLAADHVIEDEASFKVSVKNALQYSEQGKLVTFGIVGDKPETGYGYIKRGRALEENKGPSNLAYVVDKFVEKPSREMAQEYIDSGEYFWNSGMFMFKAKRYLEELEKFRPDIYQACNKAILTQECDLDFIRVNKQAFIDCPDESIDYAVMEKTEEAVVVPLDAGWSDIGSFSALWDVSDKDNSGNAVYGDVQTNDVKNSMIISRDKLTTAVGVEDLVIVSTKDAVLVTHKEKAQNVKQIVGKLKNSERSETTMHRQVYRPWGHYDSVDVGERFKVKRITVKPGAKLSLQKHNHRAEHWIVVKGTARVTIADDVSLVKENQSVYIPIGVVHALENPENVELELIEVQTGSYLEEDDIVRYEDKYGRS